MKVVLIKIQTGSEYNEADIIRAADLTIGDKYHHELL